MFVSLGCQIDTKTGKDAIGLVGQGVVNDPSNKSLRFDILRFGIEEFCRELLSSGAPLRLADDQPVIGRFFASKCETKIIDEQKRNTVLVQFGGSGYAWTVGTGRMGFRAQGLFELAPDFRLAGEALYVYFRPVHVDTSDFTLLSTERPLAQAVLEVTRVNESDLGKAIIDAQLSRGFTVMRYDVDGHTDFSLGLIEPGERPFRPFSVLSSNQRTIANGRTELHVGQQDYLGKIHLDGNEAISLYLKLDGARAVDVAILPAQVAGPRLSQILEKPGLPKDLGGQVLLTTLSSVAPLRSTIPLPPGDYYLVFDHSTELGTSHPTPQALPSRVDYLVQAGPSEPAP